MNDDVANPLNSTNDPRPPNGKTPDGPEPPAQSGEAADLQSSQSDRVVPGGKPSATNHQDAAFHHESAAYHHRQAAQFLDSGQVAAAERHIWAAFGHSLNAHEATRVGIAALRGDQAIPTDGTPD